MFEDREIHVLAYNLETVLAEKFTAVLSFNVINSRMKDFYDIHMLVTGHGGSISPGVFAEALNNTAGQRQYYFILSDYPHISVSELKNAVAFISYNRRSCGN